MREFAAQPPALAILDVGLPDLNGFELFKQLQALPGGDQVPDAVPHRAQRRDRPRRGAGAGRRRLHRQALLAARTGGAGAHHPAPQRAARSRPRPLRRPHHRAALRARRGAAPDPLLRPPAGTLALRIRHPAAAGAKARPRVHAATNCWTRSGTATATASTAPWTPTSRPCAPSSRRWRPSVEPIRTLRGSGYALSEELPPSRSREHPLEQAQPHLHRHPADLRGGPGLHAVPRGGGPRPALPRIGRGIAGRDRAADGQPGGAGRARRRHRHQPAGAAVQVGLRAQLRSPHLQRHQAPGRAAAVRHRPQRPRAVRLAGPCRGRRLLAMARRPAGAARRIRRAHHARRGERPARLR